MASTKDQLEAYAYEGRRQATGLLLGEEEAGADPRRRINRGVAGGVVVAVLAMAGFGVAGWLGAGRGPALPESGVIIVQGTGDRYVAVDGVVHPALNLASARLVGGGQTTEVKADVLADRPRGLPIGIPHAPDSLPDKENLSSGPWTNCTTAEIGATEPAVDLIVGAPAPARGRFGPDDAVVISNSAGLHWLLMQGRRFPLDQQARRQLDLQLASVLTLPDEVITTIPEGRKLVTPDVPGRGSAPAVAIPEVPGRVGDLVTTSVPGVGDRFYAIQADGLSPVTPFVFTLLAGSGAESAEVAAAAVAAAPESPRPAPGVAGWPKSKPNVVTPMRGQPLCVSTTPGAAPGDAAWSVEVALPMDVPLPDGARPVATNDIQGVLRSVTMRPGSGAFVKAASSSGQDGALTLITDAGLRYPVPPGDAAERLGYDLGAAQNVPKSFVDLLPSGPVLDPDAAKKEFAGE